MNLAEAGLKHLILLPPSSEDLDSRVSHYAWLRARLFVPKDLLSSILRAEIREHVGTARRLEKRQKREKDGVL